MSSMCALSRTSAMSSSRIRPATRGVYAAPPWHLLGLWRADAPVRVVRGARQDGEDGSLGIEEEPMKKLLLLVAFAAGYVLGAKAGRQRYEQIMNAANRVKDDPHVRSAASTVAETAKEQAPVAAHKVAAAASTAASAV